MEESANIHVRPVALLPGHHNHHTSKPHQIRIVGHFVSSLATRPHDAVFLPAVGFGGGPLSPANHPCATSEKNKQVYFHIHLSKGSSERPVQLRHSL